MAEGATKLRDKNPSLKIIEDNFHRSRTKLSELIAVKLRNMAENVDSLTTHGLNLKTAYEEFSVVAKILSKALQRYGCTLESSDTISVKHDVYSDCTQIMTAINHQLELLNADTLSDIDIQTTVSERITTRRDEISQIFSNNKQAVDVKENISKYFESLQLQQSDLLPSSVSEEDLMTIDKISPDRSNLNIQTEFSSTNHYNNAPKNDSLYNLAPITSTVGRFAAYQPSNKYIPNYYLNLSLTLRHHVDRLMQEKRTKCFVSSLNVLVQKER